MSDGVCSIRRTLLPALMAALLGGTPHAIAFTPAAASPPPAVASTGTSTTLAPPAVASPFTSPSAMASPHLANSPAAGTSAASSSGAAGSNARADDIRDIRGPKTVLPSWLLPALLAGVALLALGAYGAWRWQRRRRCPRPLLPFEVALQRLEEIRALMWPSSAREFSIAVSDIVRRYIEQRFEVNAAHRTTEEFLHDLLQSPIPALARHRGLLSEFLHQCDLVKFAGMSLSTQDMESLHYSARAFVLETKLDEPSPSSVGTAGTQIRKPSFSSIDNAVNDIDKPLRTNSPRSGGA